MPNSTVILTGFEPFGKFAENPSEQIVRALDGQVISDHTVKGIILPVVFSPGIEELINAIEDLNPVAVISLGLAAQRTKITPERIAINLHDAEMPDNAGHQPMDQQIIRGGPPAYWSTLPVKAIIEALLAEGYKAEQSTSAGTFVCNHVFYRLMHYLHGSGTTLGGFIHLPPTVESAINDACDVSLSSLIQAVRTVVATSVVYAPSASQTRTF